MASIFHAPAGLSLALVLAGTQLASGSARPQEDLAGAVYSAPHGAWKRSAGTSGASSYVRFESRTEKGTRVSIQVWAHGMGTRSLEQWCSLELRFARSTGRVSGVHRGQRTVAGQAARCVQYHLGSGSAAGVVDATYLGWREAVYRIAVRVPPSARKSLDKLVAQALAGLELRAGDPASSAQRPFTCEDPIRGNVLTVVRAAGPRAPHRYLEALPGAARANGGLPIVLAVGERLGEGARAFLRKYRPERILIAGGPHPELPQAEEAHPSWRSGGAVVISPAALEQAVAAAALATRLGVPLLVEGPDLAERLRALRPARLLVAGELQLPPLGGLDPQVERLADALALARRAGGGSYIALCNTAAGPRCESAVFAAALAVQHRGVVLPIAEEVHLHRCALKGTRERPPGCSSSSQGRYAAGTLRVPGREVLVAAPVIGRVCISGVESDRFGRPRIDLDGDGRLEAGDEEPRIGASVLIGGRPYAFSVRFQTALGHPGRGEALLIEPDPERIRAAVRSFVARLGAGEHLAIVGTPDRIPFAIRESRAYFRSVDIKQELAGDAPYADLDDDSSLELAVGRILPADLESGSVTVATSMAYSRFEGPWLARATLLAPGFASDEGRGSLLWVWPESESLARGVAAELDATGVRCETFLRDQVRADAVLRSLSRAGWIGHMNHSNQTTWGIRPGAYIRSADLPPLEGAPIVFDTGCSSAGIDLVAPLEASLPGRFFRLGAVAYLGNTRPASLGTEVALEQMFARLAAGGASIGQAYRDGRNLLAHLLEQGSIDPELGGWTFDPGIYPRMWAQFHNLNLFGDPGLVPRLPAASHPPALAVRLEKTANPRRLHLSVRRRGAARTDPLLMLADAGQGEPREALLRTATGLTLGLVPHFYLQRGTLAPLRSDLAVAPGAWVDIALPPLGNAVALRRIGGPPWVERGYAVERDPGGAARLRMAIPLIETSLERGSGELLDRVDFEVLFSGPPGTSPEPRRVLNQGVRHIFRPPPLRGGQISRAAQAVLEQIRARRYDPLARGLEHLRLRCDRSESEGILGASSAIISWKRGAQPRCELEGLPPALEAHRGEVELAFAALVDLVLGRPWGAMLERGYNIELEARAGGGSTLVLARARSDESAEQVRLEVSAQGRIETMRRRRFGVEEVVRYLWRSTPAGDLLVRQTSEGVKYGQPRVVELDYGKRAGSFLLPARIRVSVPGILAHSSEFNLRCETIQGGD